ncbi:bacteriocin biosynthesis protein SagD [Streptomyces sp. AS58]|uniref:TOMM precursor leader peptide-binding protein n=1 Tax=Streptomyces sp. AS58 TaxID=1519489 RepID=UPI0006ADA0DB|nr:TOMM precursor leader peptide-binding protein [Streptomyces sp. AS58]KOV59018.1 bacteriocin biosynthesis protein SagD [Streptomyces sp. AS58]
MTGLLRTALDRQGHTGIEVSVRALGLVDAFADAPTPFDGTANTVPVHLYAGQALAGPPTGGASPCPHCLTRRWQAVRSVALRDALELGGTTHESGPWPYAVPFAADALASLVAQVAAQPVREPFPDVHVLDLRSLTVRHYPLVPDPQCPACSAPVPDTAEGAAVTLSPAPKHEPGSFRLRGIEAYDIDVAAFANPVFGALGPSVVQDVSSTSTSATIGCFSMRSGEYLRETFWGGHAGSFGASARIGVLEGLERYAGMRARGKRTTVYGTLDEFGEDAVDPRRVGLYSEAFHRENPRVVPFAPDRVIPWVWGHSLRDGTPRLVPEILTYYHAPGLENRFVQESSNGCASGGCVEEAVYFGLMEVVERDAFLLTWYGRQPLPEIDPATSARPATRHMVERLAMYGYRARFFDTRITFPIPVVTGVAERLDGGLGRMCFGAGAGLDPESALDAALCEIATDAVNLQGRSERDEARLRAMAKDFTEVTALHDHPLVYGVPEMGVHADFLLRATPTRGPLAVADLAWPDASGAMVSPDLRDDLERCVAAVTAAGFDVVVVDQTLPEQRLLGLHTFSVLVPGLLPIDFGWSRQRALGMPRLRTALREAGLRERDLETADLNPAPHPFP